MILLTRAGVAGLLLLICTFFRCGNDSVDATAVQLNDCSKCCNYMKIDTTLEISEDCAKCLVTNFKKNGYTFPSTSDNPLKGFAMNNKELNDFHEIIRKGTQKDSSRITPTQIEIYALFGIYHGTASATSTKVVTTPHQVFEVQQTLPDLNVVLGYYNFIRPCPYFCPDNQGDLESWKESDCEKVQ